MKQYAVSILVGGKGVEAVVVARSAADAIAVVKAQYGNNVPVFGARIMG